MHVWIDREGCISCGQCEETCPQVFAIMEDGLADVTQQPDEELEDLAQVAVRYLSFIPRPERFRRRKALCHGRGLFFVWGWTEKARISIAFCHLSVLQ